MPIRARCSGCGRTYELSDDAAGRNMRCGGCGAGFVVPAGTRATPPGPPPPPFSTAVADSSRAAAHIRLVAIFNIIMGGLALILSSLSVLSILPVLRKAFGEEFTASFTSFGGAFLTALPIASSQVCLAAAVAAVTAGVSLLEKKPGARKLAVTVGIINCVNFFNCCAYPLGLACGIYTLATLSQLGVVNMLERTEMAGRRARERTAR